MADIEPRYPLPERIASLFGQIDDLDSHEAIPANLCASEFGLGAEQFASISLDTPDGHAPLILQEFGASWLGPLAEKMDRYNAHTPFPADIADLKLKMKPSDYVRCHVRVAPFDCEQVGMYIDRYSFEDVFCSASDMPHYEGGKRPIENSNESLKGQSDAVLRKFFVDNHRRVLQD